MKSCVENIMRGDTIVMAMTDHLFKRVGLRKTSENYYIVVDIDPLGPVIINAVSGDKIVVTSQYQSAIIRILKR